MAVQPTSHKPSVALPSEEVAKHFFTSSNARFHAYHATGAGKKHVKRVPSESAKYKELRGRAAITNAADWKHGITYRPETGDCSQKRDFPVQPLDNAPLDRNLCRLWTNRGREGGSVGAPHPMSSDTAHRAAFPQRIGGQPPRTESCRPENDRITERDMLVKDSVTKQKFGLPDPKMAQRFRGQLLDPPANSSPLPAPWCEAGAFHSTLQKAHSTSVLNEGPAPHTWHARRPRPRNPPPGETW